MSTTKTMRQKIVEAARKRFIHYGYGKTTMAEVASDCNMSSGNLYRYFPGKLDIAEEIGREATQHVLEQMRQAAREAAPRASNMLRACLRKLLQVSYGHRYDEKVLEMVTFLRQERPTFYEWHGHAERAVITEILMQGQASGEFHLADPEWTASLIRSATFKFHVPQLYAVAPIEELYEELEGVLDLLLHGLSAGSQAASARRRLGGGSEQPLGASAESSH
jgi:AcrR family transcriptional regulator